MERNQATQKKQIRLDYFVEGRDQRGTRRRKVRSFFESRTNIACFRYGVHRLQHSGSGAISIRQDAPQLRGRSMASVDVQVSRD